MQRALGTARDRRRSARAGRGWRRRHDTCPYFASAGKHPTAHRLPRPGMTHSCAPLRAPLNQQRCITSACWHNTPRIEAPSSAALARNVPAARALLRRERLSTSPRARTSSAFASFFCRRLLFAHPFPPFALFRPGVPRYLCAAGHARRRASRAHLVVVFTASRPMACRAGVASRSLSLRVLALSLSA